MQFHATGTFVVKMSPQTVHDEVLGLTVSRLSIDKQFHGDLQATSKGEMLAARSAIQGSASYVALEKVTGSLQGRAGTFVLQHSGTMTRGVPQLFVTVVPDSGTQQLLGLSGQLAIDIVDGKHLYDFDYSIADSN